VAGLSCGREHCCRFIEEDAAAKVHNYHDAASAPLKQRGARAGFTCGICEPSCGRLVLMMAVVTLAVSTPASSHTFYIYKSLLSG